MFEIRRKSIGMGLRVALAIVTGLCVPGAASAGEEWILGMEELHRLDRLPLYRPAAKIGAVTSHDRTGGNDDGFSGKHSFLRKEADGLVIADLEGPGIVYRIWTPTPTDDPVAFYFDGESTPRIEVKFREIFSGTQPPFKAPIVGYGAGGFYSYLPIPYEKSLKILVKAERVQFYQINHATYPEGTPIRSFTLSPSPSVAADEERARKLFSLSGSDLSSWVVPRGATVDAVRCNTSIEAGKAVKIFDSDKPGRIAGIRLGPAESFAGRDRGIVLRASFDGEESPSILCPVGDFFGYAWGRPAMKSLLLGTADGMNYCYFPMPFDRAAKLELVSEKDDGPPIEVRAEVLFSSVPRLAGEGRFYAVWRREEPTTQGKPFLLVEAEGRGRLVASILQSQGMVSGNTYFFEGDDQTTIDGALAIHGTGSEDFFNGGWYDVPGRWEKQISFPFSGCLGYQKHLGRTGGYRLLLTDAYEYRESLRHAIEHADVENKLLTDYVGVSFLYADRAPAGAGKLLPPAKRKVVDFDRIVFAAWWSVPIQAFSFQGTTLTKKGERLGEEDVRFLSLRAEGQDFFGHPFVSPTCDIPVAGRYHVSIECVKGPDQACVQLFQNEAPVSDAVDLWAEKRTKSGALRLGTLDFAEGPNALMIKLPKKNEKSTGLGFDLISIICERAQ